MNVAEVKRRIRGTHIRVWEEKRLPKGLGTQLVLSNRDFISVFRNGRVLVQGKNIEETKAALELPEERKKRQKAR